MAKTVNASSWPVSMIFSMNTETLSGDSTSNFLNSLFFRETGALSRAVRDIFLNDELSIDKSSSSSDPFFFLKRRIKNIIKPRRSATTTQNHHFVNIDGPCSSSTITTSVEAVFSTFLSRFAFLAAEYGNSQIFTETSSLLKSRSRVL